MASTNNIDLYVDEAYLLALISDEPIPISDEKYANELSLQEALSSSSSNPSNLPQNPSNFNFEFRYSQVKKEPKQELSLQEALPSSSLNPSNPPQNPSNFNFEFIYSQVKKEPKQEYMETGESSETKPFFCGICKGCKKTQEIFTGLPKCTHDFCMNCIAKYIESKIQDNVSLVKCPNPKCRQVIEPETCGSVLPKAVFERWQTALFEAMIPGYQKFYCPYKDCSVLMVDDGGVEVRSSECPNCRRLFCAKCQVKWHVGVSCEEFVKLVKDERKI